jgi:hypothetical protein
VVPSPSLFSQQRASGLNRSKASGTVSQAASVAISDPPFLRHPIQFGPNSRALTDVSPSTPALTVATSSTPRPES